MELKYQISICIPLFNESESIFELYTWLIKVLNHHSFKYEIIFVDDGSSDDSWSEIKKIIKSDQYVKAVKFRRNYGKSAALHTAFQISSGEVVITMDADLQDSPEEIPDLYKMITLDKFHLVSGYKAKRYDPLSKTIPTKLFNLVTRKISGINLRDFNCGLKAYSYNVVKSIEIYGEMHRYIPVLAKRAGFDKIGEKVVSHQKRKYGVTKFGVERFVNGFLDLLTVTFMSKFSKKPMHFFGLLGISFFTIGFLIASYFAFAKYVWNIYNMTDRPLFYLGILSMIIGSQLFLTGFLAELISRSNSDRNKYMIAERINLRS